jgi:hypothetical protein
METVALADNVKDADFRVNHAIRRHRVMATAWKRQLETRRSQMRRTSRIPVACAVVARAARPDSR